MSNSKKKISNKAIDSKLIRWLYSFVKPYSKAVFLALLLTISISFLGPVRPLLIQQAIDNHIAVSDLEGLIPILLLITGVLIAETVLTVANLYLMNWIGQNTLYKLRVAVFEKIQSFHVQYFDKNPIGRLVTRATNDIEAIDELVSSGVINMMGNLLKIFFIFYFMITLDVKLTLISLSMIPILIWVTAIFKNKLRISFLNVRDQVSRLNAFIQEHINGISIVQLFNQQDREFDKYKAINQDHKKAHIQTIFYFAMFWPIVEVLSTVGMALIIWFGGASVLVDGLTFGVLVAFIQYVRQFFQPIRDISEKFNTLQSAMAATERVVGVLETETDIKWESISEQVELIESEVGKIEFKDVTFRYNPNDKDVVKKVSFVAETGQMVAVVGATGAGKTSLINLVSRFYDIEQGEILINGISSKDYTKKSLRKNFGLVLQDNALFSGTILDNITLGEKSIQTEKVIEASKMVGAHDFIKRFSKGYEHELSERGQSLSMGQRQLICFIRAIVYDPPIIILDEATSNIDSETEELVTQALNKVLEGRTSIIIAHRLSTILHADKILVMHKGELREEGNHQELLKIENGLYKKLYEIQYKDQLIEN